MNCHICIESYNVGNRIPRNLSCGHTFCERCLKKLEKFGSGNELECPKCRKKSKYPFSICYAIYDKILLEHKAEIDDQCKFHEYEKVRFYCEFDKIGICPICVKTFHSAHKILPIRDKLISEQNQMNLRKWNDYFEMKKTRKKETIEKLNGYLKELECDKIKILQDLNKNFDEICDELFQTQSEMKNEIENLYLKEKKKLSLIKSSVNESIGELSETLRKLETDEIYMKIVNSPNDEIIFYESYVNQIRIQNQKFNEIHKEFSKQNFQINYKTISYTKDIILRKSQTPLSNLFKEENILKHNVILLGDNKDKTILNFDLNSKQITVMHYQLGLPYEFLDYSAICPYKTNSILVTGGCIYSSYKHTASKNTFIAKIILNNEISFSEFRPMSIERFAHGLCQVKSTPYVFGGHNGISPLDSIEYYEEKEDKWILLQNSKMHTAREIFAYCLMNERYIYVFGGFNETHLDSIEKFDIFTKEWMLINAKMKKNNQNATAVPLNSKEIVIIGGYTGTIQKTIDIFNLETETWNSVEKMKVARRKSHCFKFDDKIYIFGGEGNDVEEHIPEILDLKDMTTSFLSRFDSIIYKSLNFWSSTMIS